MTPSELENWLQARPQETRAQEAVWIASRAAARVLPVLLSQFRSQSRSRDLMRLETCRALLVSGGPAGWSLPEAKSAMALPPFISPHDLISSHKHSPAARLLTGFGLLPIDVARAAAFAVHAATGEDSVQAAVRSVSLVVDDAKAREAFSADVASLTVGTLEEAPMPLWLDRRPAAIVRLWEEAKSQLPQNFSGSTDGDDAEDDWRFWIDWYEDLLEGRPQNRALLTEIALIPEADWEKGSAHVNAIIRQIVEQHESGASDFDASLKAMPNAPKSRIAETKTAMERHRSDLPPVFDAILGYIALEIERLQKRNYVSELDQEEAERQIRTLVTIYKAVGQLQALVPETGEMSVEDAEKAEKLGRLYLNKFKEWPRDNAEEMIDSTYRFGLVGLTTFALPMIGVPVHYALGAGMTVFAGKKLLENAKAAKDLISSKGPE